MLSVDSKGNIYPCIRFTPFTLNNADEYKIGDIYTGINEDLLRPFYNLTAESQSTEECLNCNVASSCPWCSGFNYDDAKGETLFHRATYHCKMWKANMRANEYFWKQLSIILGEDNPRDISRKKRAQQRAMDEGNYILIITNDNIEPHCSYKNTKGFNNKMSNETINKVIKFCNDNYYTPVLLGDGDVPDCMQIGGTSGKSLITVHNYELNEDITENNIVLISKYHIDDLCKIIFNIIENDKVNRVNIIISDLELWNDTDVNSYKNQLEKISQKLYGLYLNDRRVELNVLTDIFYNKEIVGCGSGINSFTVAPNGKIYICPAFYYNNEDDYIGDLDMGIHIKRQKMLKIENSYMCSNCDAYHCRRCLYLNKKMTNEINTPSKIQCIVSHVERNISRELEIRLIKMDLIKPTNFINKIDYLDLIDNLYRKERLI